MARRLFMVVETFPPKNLDAIYARFHDKGRMLPEGLEFIDSWLTADNTTVYQLMETNNPDLLTEWSQYWSDLVSFEFLELRDKPTKS